MKPPIKIGSRGSQLALWQANHIQQRLAAHGVEAVIEIIKTTGDKITDVPLAQVGGKGLFTKEIEEALLEHRVDVAVHSLKDLPTELPEGLVLAAVPERECPFDAIVGKRLDELAAGAVVGTSSLRRAAQLKAMRRDLRIESIRGNLDTRLRKLDEGIYEAIVLAAAGLNRLGWSARIAELLEPGRMCPAVGQGALGIETRAAGEALEICRLLEDRATRLAVTAERAALSALGGGCQVPLGAHAEVKGESIVIHAVVADPDGSTVITATAEGPLTEPEAVGSEVARRLLRQGARSILVRVYGEAPPLAGQRILVTRAAGQAASLTSQLRCMGAEVVELPVIELEPLEFEAPAKDYDWVLFTSSNAVESYLSRAKMPSRARLAAIGPATAQSLSEAGLKPDLVAAQSTGEGLAAAFSREQTEGKRFLVPRAETAREALVRQLKDAGAEVETLAVYRNRVPEGLEDAVRALFSGASRPDWITLLSSSSVKNLVEAAGLEALVGVKIATIGPVTSETARRLGLTVTAEAADASADALALAIASGSSSNQK